MYLNGTQSTRGPDIWSCREDWGWDDGRVGMGVCFLPLSRSKCVPRPRFAWYTEEVVVFVPTWIDSVRSEGGRVSLFWRIHSAVATINCDCVGGAITLATSSLPDLLSERVLFDRIFQYYIILDASWQYMQYFSTHRWSSSHSKLIVNIVQLRPLASFLDTVWIPFIADYLWEFWSR